jgi:hypothetical protein
MDSRHRWLAPNLARKLALIRVVGSRGGRGKGLALLASVVLTRLLPELLLFAMLAFQAYIALPLAAGASALLTANLLLELLAFRFDPFGLLLELFTKFLARDVTIHDPGAVLLAFDLESGRLVLEINTGGRLVDLLPPTTRATDEFFHEVLIQDPKLRHPLSQFFLFPAAEHAGVKRIYACGAILSEGGTELSCYTRDLRHEKRKDSPQISQIITDSFFLSERKSNF